MDSATACFSAALNWDLTPFMDPLFMLSKIAPFASMIELFMAIRAISLEKLPAVDLRIPTLGGRRLAAPCLRSRTLDFGNMGSRKKKNHLVLAKYEDQRKDRNSAQ